MNNQRLFFRFVLPSVMAFALSGIYTVVDGFFVGNSLGDIGLAAINLAYPVAAFIQAVGTGIGLSGAIRYTILGGQKKQNEKVNCFASTVMLLFFVSIFLTAFILLALSSLIQLLGAKGPVCEPVKDYVEVIAAGAVLQIFATGLIPFIRNLGGSSYAMFTMIAGFVTNIILDYLLVWVYDGGMAGAAWATIIGQAVTMVAAVGYLIKKKIGFHIPVGNALWKNCSAILKVAVAPFGLAFSSQITAIFMNRALMLYGGAQSVAVYGCIAYIMAIVHLLLQGVGDGSQPLISRYYGEEKAALLKQTRRLAYITSGVIALVFLTAVFLSRHQIGILFGASTETNGGVAMYLPLFLSSLLFLAYTRTTTSFLYATEKAGLSYLLVYIEPATIFLLLQILPRISALGIIGVWIAVPVTQLMVWCIAVAIIRYIDRRSLKALQV